MLCLLAMIGDEQEAGYSVVCGTASVDAETGANFFAEKCDGLHRYVVKQKEDAYYADCINEIIK